MKTAIHFLSHLAHFLVRKMLQTKIVEKVKTQTLFSITSFRKSCRLCDNVEKYRTVEQATDDSTAHAHTVSEYFRYIDCLFLNTVSVPTPQTSCCCTYSSHYNIYIATAAPNIFTATVTAATTVVLIQSVLSGASVPAVLYFRLSISDASVQNNVRSYLRAFSYVVTSK